MTDLRADTSRAMLRAWKGALKSSLKDITYNRLQEGSIENPNNIPSETEAYLDPVTEEWVYPVDPNPEQTPDNTTATLKALVRTAKKETFKDNDILATDLKITLRQADWLLALSDEPYNSDTITYNNADYRIVKWEGDSVDIFYHFYIRKGA
mgnify:CR=1 FL=1